MLVGYTQSLQNPLIKEYTLNHNIARTTVEDGYPRVSAWTLKVMPQQRAHVSVPPEMSYSYPAGTRAADRKPQTKHGNMSSPHSVPVRPAVSGFVKLRNGS